MNRGGWRRKLHPTANITKSLNRNITKSHHHQITK